MSEANKNSWKHGWCCVCGEKGSPLFGPRGPWPIEEWSTMRGLQAVSPVPGSNVAGMGDVGPDLPAVHLGGPDDIEGGMPEGPRMQAWRMAEAAPTVEKRIEEARRIFRENGWKGPAPYPGRDREEFKRMLKIREKMQAPKE